MLKIHDVIIHNWNVLDVLGETWWTWVKSRPTEPLIKATITLTLSWEEYQELLEKNNKRPS